MRAAIAAVVGIVSLPLWVWVAKAAYWKYRVQHVREKRRRQPPA